VGEEENKGGSGRVKKSSYWEKKKIKKAVKEEENKGGSGRGRR
jgi:hypothetical protein